MEDTARKYYIDWLRVIAIGLLLIYHIAVGFQPWGGLIGFITSDESWTSLWLPMAVLNVWRIPLLFFVSGMGIYLAMQKRSWKELLLERGVRIFIPYIFGFFVIVPLQVLIWEKYNGMKLDYQAHPAHLWFLGNICVYVLLFFWLFYLMKKSRFPLFLDKLFSTPLGFIPVAVLFIAEAMILEPYPYEYYAMSLHGFFLGMMAFFFGFCFVLSGDIFWNMIVKWRWLFLLLAISLFIVRVTVYKMNVPYYLLVPESHCWIYSVLAFGCKYLNRPGNTLTYLSQAAYPIYIVHMAFQFLASALIFRTELPLPVQFVAVLVLTFAGSFAFYEIIRRIKFVRPLFGLKFGKFP